MTIKEVAALKGCHPNTVRNAINKVPQELRARAPEDPGDSWYVKSEDAKRWTPRSHGKRPPVDPATLRQHRLQVPLTDAEYASFQEDMREGETQADAGRRWLGLT